MTNTYSAVFEQEGEWWIGFVEELPGALAQERTLDDARVSLRQAVADIIQTNREMSVTGGVGSFHCAEPTCHIWADAKV